MKVAYVRVSTIEQNEARQIEALEKHGIEKWFTEKISGKDTHRPELQNMLDYVREGDTIYVHDLSRLARSTKDLLEIVEILDNKKVSLVSNKENIDSSTPTGKLMLTMIGAIAEFERTNLLERQKEGIAIAKKAGKYKGRKPIEIEDERFKNLYSDYMKREITKVELAKELNVSRPTLDRMIKEYKETHKELA
jgi:DNA invertase Pin-like site-specific DNA recombinase